MDFRGLGMQQEYDDKAAQYEQRAQAEENQQRNQDRSFGLQERGQQDQRDYYNMQDANKDATLQATMMDRQAGDRMQGLQLLMNAFNDPMGAGALDPAVGAQLAQAFGFPGLINPNFKPAGIEGMQQQIPLDKSRIMGGLPNDENTDAIFNKYRGR
jgi:hypothetical protein